MHRLLLTLGLSLFSAAALAAQAGHVVFVVGKAEVGARPARLDAAVQEGDELSTGADGYIYMKTVDNGFLILRPNSKARVTTYHVDTVNPANTRVKLELLSGVARSISGAAVKQARQNFRFNTPVAAIGVRGTDFIVYTNQQSSWVSVVSGGVVMSGFAGACGPEGSGPCEGSASRELFAGRPDAMLQIQRGQVVPQLLNNSVIAPELNVPPRSDEPVGKSAAAHAQVSGALTDISLDPAKNPVPLAIKDTSKAPDVVVPPVISPVPVPVSPAPIPLPVVENGPPEVIWGRWQSVAGVAPDQATLDKINSSAYTRPITVGSYVLSRPVNPSFVMPHEGTASFALIGAEASMQQNGGAQVAADVSNGRLDIDFGARTFATSLQVSSSVGQVGINAKGSVTQQGGLEGALFGAATVRGYLGGALAGEAVYAFKTTDNPLLSAQGVTRWSR